MSTKAKLNDKVKPIALADRDDGSLPKACVISGWGSTENSKYMSVKLLEVNVTLTDNELCANTNMYCSEGEREPGQVSVFLYTNIEKKTLVNNGNSLPKQSLNTV